MATVFNLRILSSEGQKPLCSRISAQFGTPAFPPLLSSWPQKSHNTEHLYCRDSLAVRAACSHPCDCHIAQLSLLSHPFRPFLELELKVPFVLASHSSCHLLDTVSCYSSHSREGLSQELCVQVQEDSLRIFIPSFSPHNLSNALSSHPCYRCTSDRQPGVVLVRDAMESQRLEDLKKSCLSEIGWVVCFCTAVLKQEMNQVGS